MAELEIRSAQLGEVRFADRTIEMIVMPYEAETTVTEKGRRIREVCSRGAFADINASRHRVSVNRDHHNHAVVGKAIAFHPNRSDGLMAELRISQTPLGDETLQLAEDGVLDGSAGFRIMPGGESWHERRTLRRLNKVWLVHIAMTPEPAYDGARVLAVRSSSDGEPVGATPNLDRIRAWRLQDEFASLFGE